MILLFRNDNTIYAVQATTALGKPDMDKLRWLFGGAEWLDVSSVSGVFIGPRR